MSNEEMRLHAAKVDCSVPATTLGASNESNRLSPGLKRFGRTAAPVQTLYSGFGPSDPFGHCFTGLDFTMPRRFTKDSQRFLHYHRRPALAGGVQWGGGGVDEQNQRRR